MTILNIEESAFELMMARFDLRSSSFAPRQFEQDSIALGLSSVEALAQKVEQLCSNAGDKRVKEWLDATDVCFLLNIRKRQLQNYRDSGKIGFSKIGNVIMYRPDDVMKLLKKAE